MSSLNQAPFDAVAARARLALARGPTLWRALEELADSEAFRRWLITQQPQLAEALALDRRGFLKYLGASLALGGLGACSHPPQLQIVPYIHAPPGQIDGLPRFFASVLSRNGYARGVLVESHMGRPTKIEGNPQHPASLGATDIFAQAAVLQLWDPDRSQAVMNRGVTADWADFDAMLVQARARIEHDGGAGLHVLTGASTSPTLSAQLQALHRRYPRMRWYVHEPAGNDNAFAGTRLAFGVPLTSRLHLDRAAVMLALDADVLSDPAAGVRYARDFAAGRALDSNGGTMGRLYVVEATPSLTGAQADHRLPLESARIEGFARALARRLGVAVDVRDASATAEVEDPQHVRWLEALAVDLRAHRGAALVVAGPAQPAAVHALAHAINVALDSVGSTIDYCDPVETLPEDGGTLAQLVDAMHGGSVDTLLILDANPAYDAPADLQFGDVLQRVPHVWHLGLYLDETGALAEWHLPQAHQLEAWSDARSFEGTASIAQPLIAPLYGGRSAHQILAALLGEEDARDGRELVRRQWQRQLPDEASWNAALRAGMIADTAFATRSPPAAPDVTRSATVPPLAGDESAFELLFRPDPTIGDGRWANNGWLQELPKPLSQLTWDNAAWISPLVAARYALGNGDVVELKIAGRSLQVPVWIMPGQAAHSVTLHLGYGRRRAGRVGDGQGVDAYALRTSSAPWAASGLQLRKTGARYELAGTQHHFNMEGRDLLRVETLEDYRRDPHFATAAGAEAGTPPSLYPDYPPGEYAWGMSIDLNACIGCKACTIACQAENNIPVVGRDQVRRGREMHWIRVDRYYEGSPESPRTYSQPVPCMMCEHAPCEVVCPVDATVHDAEGLNVQVYNRCVGTRFCSNNCPYKVRRFNFLQYTDQSADTLAAQRNPEVTVRGRGVMEKCTYCIQRIESAHIEADKANRRLRDGEVLTACQAVCPTQAIRFGDIADAQTSVAHAKASPRNYVMLQELNTRPRTSYLARVRNPNPALEDP
ncbi:MAG TPA: TAT-variant-translocated molybdopterin oxidoreductase [Steroidobacteraceae bacterium]